MDEVTKRLSEVDLKTVRCPRCQVRVLPGNLARHQRTRKCKVANTYKTRAEHNKERVTCARCKKEVCKNKLKRHERSQACKLAGFHFR